MTTKKLTKSAILCNGYDFGTDFHQLRQSPPCIKGLESSEVDWRFLELTTGVFHPSS